jgi:hypothetical protein
LNIRKGDLLYFNNQVNKQKKSPRKWREKNAKKAEGKK